MSEPLTFRSNPNKDFLRSAYDKEIVAGWFQRSKRRLHYLGLPGPEMLDIIEWEEYIDRFSTIERLENAQHLLFLRANVKDVEHRLHSLYGDFDKIILGGRDNYNNAPRWPYDLINLDFFGGFIYNNMARPRALRKLIQNQDAYGKSFLLILTHDLRDGDATGEKISFLDDLRRALERDYGCSEAISSFIECYKSSSTMDAARQGLYMNSFLRDNGEAAHFRVRCRAPIVYIGTGGTKMIHYVTDFDHEASEHRAVSDQSIFQVLSLGLLELRDKTFVPIDLPEL